MAEEHPRRRARQGDAADGAQRRRRAGRRGGAGAGQGAHRQHPPAVRQLQRVVPLAAHRGAGPRGQVAGRQFQRPRPAPRPARLVRAEPRRQRRVLQVDRQPVPGPRDAPLPPQLLAVAVAVAVTVAARPGTGPFRRRTAAAPLAHVADHRPHRDRPAVVVEHRLAGHLHGPFGAVGAVDAELAVHGPPVDQAAGDRGRQRGLVLRRQERRELVQGERTLPGRPAEDREQLLGPHDAVRQQVPLGAADPPAQPDPALGPGRGPELVELLAEVLQAERGQLPHRAPYAVPGAVRRLAEPYGVEVVAEPAGPGDQVVERRPGRNVIRGVFRVLGGEHGDPRYGAVGRGGTSQRWLGEPERPGSDDSRLLHSLPRSVRDSAAPRVRFPGGRCRTSVNRQGAARTGNPVAT